MNTNLPPCPACSEDMTYEMPPLLACPMCGHEWSAESEATHEAEPAGVTDAYGTPLADGDTVTVVKDLKVKGSSQVVKVGTKVKNIRLADGFGGHDIDCKVDGFGPMQLKSEFVKKS